MNIEFNDEQLSTFFHRREFRCKGMDACCGGAAPIDTIGLIPLLTLTRWILGVPLEVSSGFRCIIHNSRTPDAVPGSRHTLGTAADVFSRHVSSHAVWVAFLEARQELGYGFAIHYDLKKFVHIDTRD